MYLTDLVNVKELIDWRGDEAESISCYAGVTPGLMREVFEGKAELSSEEVVHLSRHLRIPFSAAMCEKLIMLDNKRYRHRAILQEYNKKLCYIIKMAVMDNEAAKDYLKRYSWDYERGTTAMYGDFIDGKPVTYSRYLYLKAAIDDCIDSIEVHERDKRRRGLGGEPEVAEREKMPYLSKFLESAEHIEQITAEQGESGALWETFMYLSNVIAGYMVKSKENERKDAIKERFNI